MGGKRCPGSRGHRCTGWCGRCCPGSSSGPINCCCGWRIRSYATNGLAVPTRDAAPPAAKAGWSRHLKPVVVVLGWRRRQSGITERRVTVAALAAMPGFWLGILLMLVLAVQLGWLPPSGKGSPSHLFMPVFTVGILGGLWIALEMRSREAASEILVLARALGLVLRHVGILLSGIILVEFVFALPGMGLLLANAARAQDIAVVGTAAAVFIWMALLSRFLGNLLLAAIDGTPPARTGASGGTESWPALAIGGGVTLVLLLLLFLAPPLAPQDPIMASITERLAPPFWVDAKVVGGLEQPAGSWNHPLGTDRLGRDVLSRVLYGGRTAALIGLPMALLALLVGFPMVIARVMLDRTRAWSLIYGIEGVLEGMVAVPWLLIGVLIQVSLGGGWPCRKPGRQPPGVSRNALAQGAAGGVGAGGWGKPPSSPASTGGAAARGALPSRDPGDECRPWLLWPGRSAAPAGPGRDGR